MVHATAGRGRVHAQRRWPRLGGRLGLRLPDSLAAFYRLLGQRRDLTSNQDTLIALDSLAVVDGTLVYRIEAQGCASWGVQVADLGLADPPVVFCEGYAEGRPWQAFLGSFSLAAVELVLGEALFGGAGGRAGNRALDEDDGVRLDGLYERLPFPDYPAWWQPGAQQAVRWFSGPGVLLREGEQPDLALGTRAEAPAGPLDRTPGRAARRLAHHPLPMTQTAGSPPAAASVRR